MDETMIDDLFAAVGNHMPAPRQFWIGQGWKLSSAANDRPDSRFEWWFANEVKGLPPYWGEPVAITDDELVPKTQRVPWYHARSINSEA